MQTTPSNLVSVPSYRCLKSRHYLAEIGTLNPSLYLKQGLMASVYLSLNPIKNIGMIC
jgi:hypothetical protein